MEVSKPRSSKATGKCLTRSGSACSPFMYHFNFAAGLLFLEVQLTSTLSPMWYLGKPPVMTGPSSGKSGNEGEIQAHLSIDFWALRDMTDGHWPTKKLFV